MSEPEPVWRVGDHVSFNAEHGRLDGSICAVEKTEIRMVAARQVWRIPREDWPFLERREEPSDAGG